MILSAIASVIPLFKGRKGKIVLTVAFVIATFYGCGYALEHWRHEEWKRHLSGPYAGQAWIGNPGESPSGSLRGPRGNTFEIYLLGGTNPPLLVLRSRAGILVWARKLQPVDHADPAREGRVQRIYWIELVQVRKSGAGYDVVFKCGWTRGAHQFGVVRLTRELVWQDFWIEASSP